VISRQILLLVPVLWVLTGCDSIERPRIAAAQDDGRAVHPVTVQLQTDVSTDFTSNFEDRMVIVEAIEVAPVKRAEGIVLLENVKATIIGVSCQELLSKYADLRDCKEVDNIELRYGDIEFNVATDAAGYATVYLGDAEKYRISVESWVSEEDGKCHWSGSEIVERSSTNIALPVLVYCE